MTPLQAGRGGETSNTGRTVTVLTDGREVEVIREATPDGELFVARLTGAPGILFQAGDHQSALNGLVVIVRLHTEKGLPLPEPEYAISFSGSEAGS